MSLPSGVATLILVAALQKGQITSMVRSMVASPGGPQRSRETELVTIEVGKMKVALSPLGIARHGRGLVAGRRGKVVQGSDVADVDDDAPARRPTLLFGLGDQIEIAVAGAKAGE